jgi:hypothetical protein
MLLGVLIATVLVLVGAGLFAFLLDVITDPLHRWRPPRD